MRVFMDSDVIISALISTKGAAYQLMHMSRVKAVISNESKRELKMVAKRLRIEQTKLDRLIKKRCEVMKITQDRKMIMMIIKGYKIFVSDRNDAHIVAGAKYAQVKYLITYNLRHYKRDNIKDELGISVITPALLMQRLRSS